MGSLNPVKTLGILQNFAKTRGLTRTCDHFKDFVKRPKTLKISQKHAETLGFHEDYVITLGDLWKH